MRYFREKAEQAMRLARDSTDPVLQKSLTELALEYFARAIAIEAGVKSQTLLLEAHLAETGPFAPEIEQRGKIQRMIGRRARQAQ